ncbi:B12-binding domain-containing radical SAM protein [Thermogladius sp. 4427co]|uniref:B12-binding domain-containing radical SAM protein n=1 Tax=Thermogladius sp. 4427co TaxID=3450718 RepID=UPI003F79D4BC
MVVLVEVNRVLKNPLRVNVRIAYVYPSFYEVMTSSLAHDILYWYANRRDDVYLERVVYEKKGGEARSIETGSPLRDFPIILSTLHYELDIANLVRILWSSGISPFRKERRQLLIIGGPVAISNPEPFAEIADAFIIGEIESTIDRVLEILSARAGESKKVVLEELSGLEYVYIPGLKEHAARSFVENLDNVEYPLRQVFDTERQPVFGLGFKLELSRGCIYWCSFCMEKRVFQPFRHRSRGVIKTLVEKGAEYTGLNRYVLYALSFPVVAEDFYALELLAESGARAVLPSLRLEKLTPEAVELIKSVGQREVSIAPESFSFHTQRLLMKYPGLVNTLVERITRIIDMGLDVKLYLIYGVKGEKLEDVRATVETVKSIASYARKKGRRVVASFNPLIPKARTPFAYIGMEDPGRLRNLARYIAGELRSVAEIRPYDIKSGVIQAAISLGDRRLGRVLVEWALRGGGLTAWNRALKAGGISIEYVYTGLKPGEPVPWENIVLDKNSDEVSLIQFKTIKRFYGLGEG